MATFHFELVSPDKQQFSGAAESVLVPGAEGDFQVFSQHAPVMTALRPGVLAIDEGAGKHTRFFIRGGFADVNPTGLIVLAETAVPAHELNAEWINAQIKDAEESAKPAAQEKLDRLRELKESMKL